MASVLYLTQDGITDHIGQAQIAPYLLELARLGHKIHILSAEKPGRDEARTRYQGWFDEVGIKWTTVRYSNRPPLVSSFYTLALMLRAAKRIAKAERPDIIHCRSYLPLEIASKMKRQFGSKYLADFRDFWADVGIETKRFKLVFRWFRQREGRVLGNADHVVTLTERAADVLIARHPHVAGGDRANYTVIPCCADFDLFDPVRVSADAVARRRVELDIPEDASVLIYLGSLGPDYLLRHMIELFREMRALRPNAIFLFLANNGKELVESEAETAGIPKDALRFISVDRRDIPEYLGMAALSPVFIRPTLSKSGCSPTKLGELFAMNVPIIANSGFGDIDRVVRLDRNASTVIADFEPETLRQALRDVLSVSEKRRAGIRQASGEYALDEGVRRYDRIYSKLTGHPDGDGPAATRGTC
jgi:glycosyltransferase involved in cell wall biosynthesis